MNRSALSHLTKQLSLPQHQVSATVKLLEEGATIPFISRYRKEATGSLDEMQVASIQQEVKRLEELEKRREAILKSIDEQGLLTEDLRLQINSTWELNQLEDLYLPYKPKRRTRATIARENGLEPLTKIIMAQRERNIEQRAAAFLGEKVTSEDDALQGARDIIAEWVNEHATARNKVRSHYRKQAMLTARVKDDKKEEGEKYQDYFDHREPLAKCPSHRILAIFRAEQEDILRVNLEVDKDQVVDQLREMFVKRGSTTSAHIEEAIEDSYQRLMAPSIANEFKKLAKERADKEAISVFSENLRQLLLSPPLGSVPVLAIDPGFKSGCKVACLDKQGNFLEHATIFPHPPKKNARTAEEQVQKLISKYQIEAIAIGNGTAGRETESFVKGVLGADSKVELFMVSEAGASVYSASQVARDEFPDLDLTVRGAISIGRRLMDPLAELVKIDPKSIGVGQYQHDVNQEQLKAQLDEVVMLAVNQVGVNLNTASRHLLQYVSGIGPKVAANIVEYRHENGPFSSRAQLKKVRGLGPKAFEQSAGFLRIPDGKNPLDNSAVHPESYHVVEQMAKDLGQPVKALMEKESLRSQVTIRKYVTENTGIPTLEDIMKELAKPGLDPRGTAAAFSFSEKVKDIKDLEPNMRLPGIITNLAKFGAFVDIGIKENGLIHISQIADKFVKDPADELKLGQQVTVKVLDVDIDRKRIQLSLKEA